MAWYVCHGWYHGHATNKSNSVNPCCLAIVGPLLLPVYRKSAMPFSNSLDDVIAADAVTRCQVPCPHLVFGRHSVNHYGVHVVV